MGKMSRALCFIIVVLGFTFFPGLAESKGSTVLHVGSHSHSHGGTLQEYQSQFLNI